MQDKAPLVSFILPCYNVADYLEKSLQAVQNQTLADWECILVDDGSTDETARIIKPWTDEDPRFKYVYQKNKGLSGARNTGIEKASGAYIYFYDPDDLIAETTLENLVGLSQDQVDIVIGKNAITHGQNTEIKDYLNHYQHTLKTIDNTNKNLLKIAIEEDIICVAWNKLIRKSFITKHNLQFKKGILHEDELWFFETLFYARAVVFNNTATYFYNVANTNSITNTFKKKNLDSYLEILPVVHKNYVLKTTDSVAQQMAGNYLEHLKYKTLTHCYKQLSKSDKRASDVDIVETFKTLTPSYANPNLLASKNKKQLVALQQVQSLLPAKQIKYLKYAGANRLDRKLKKQLILAQIKLKNLGN
ncbi:glycosyltransferase family 2 protein [Bizionia sp. KMM 8389]